MEKKVFEAILKSGLDYVKQADPTMVVCASILAIGMIGAGVACGLLSRRTQIALGPKAVYHNNSNNETAAGFKPRSRSGDVTQNHVANDSAAMTVGEP